MKCFSGAAGTAEAVQAADGAIDSGANIVGNSGRGGGSIASSGSGGSTSSLDSLDLDVGEFDPSENFIAGSSDDVPVDEANPGGNPPRPGSGGSGVNSGRETPDQIIQGQGGSGGGNQPQGGDIFSNMGTFGEPASPTNEGSPPGSPPRPARRDPNVQPRMKRW